MATAEKNIARYLEQMWGNPDLVISVGGKSKFEVMASIVLGEAMATVRTNSAPSLLNFWQTNCAQLESQEDKAKATIIWIHSRLLKSEV